MNHSSLTLMMDLPSRVAARFAATPLTKPGLNEYDLKAGSLGFTLILDVPDDGDGGIPTGSVEVDKDFASRDDLLDHEDDILRAVNRFVGKRVTWSAGEWSTNRMRGTWGRSLGLPHR